MPSSFLMSSSCAARSPLSSCSLPQSHHRSTSSLRNAFSSNHYYHCNTHQGRLILFARLSFSTSNSAIESHGLVHYNRSLPTKSVLDFDSETNKLPTQEKEEEVFNWVEKTERLPMIVAEMGNEMIPTKNREEFSNRVEKINATAEEKPEILGFPKRFEAGLVADNFVERIRRPVGIQQIEILHLYEKGVGNLTLSNVNSLLMSLENSDEIDLAVKLFHELPSYGLVPNSRTFFTMVRCYCKKKELEEARLILDQMVENGFPPNVVTCTIVISSFCRRGKLQKAFEILKLMGQIGCEPSVRTFNCLISGLCYVGRVEEAFELLSKIKKSSKKPDIYTYTAVMDGFCKVGRTDESKELLEEAIAAGLEPTVVTFNTLFNGLCKEGRPLEGINLLRQMKERNCQPDHITYSTLLHGLLKWNEISASLEVYNEMLAIGVEVEERLENTLLRRICRRSWVDEKLLKDVEEVFERMKKVGNNPYLYTCCLVIQTFCIRGETEKAVDNFHQMLRIGYRPRLITLNALIRSLCREGRVDNAVRLLFFMSKVNIVPSKISYNLLINEFSQQDKFLDACKVYGAALKRGVVPHCQPRSNVPHRQVKKNFEE